MKTSDNQILKYWKREKYSPLLKIFGMKKYGIAYLPLHDGYVPRWLFDRMVKLGGIILKHIVDDFGSDELLIRLADPVWFQALGCVLGFDWHSSGLTTVVTAALKEAIKKEEIGIYIAGGKGRISRKAPQEIIDICRKLDLDYRSLIEASRLTAKVDNSLLLDGYSLYHHVIVFDEYGKWTVIQQGMNISSKYARRYHWTSLNLRNFIVEPHSGLIGDKAHNIVIDMTSRRSEEARSMSLDIIRENRLKRDLHKAREKIGGELDRWLGRHLDENYKLLILPERLNWKAIREAYELQPRNFKELLLIEGIGPETIRALALVSEIIYGAPPSKVDPVRYTFAVGGKDGVPFPVNRGTYDYVIRFFEELLSKVDDYRYRKERLYKLSRLLPYITIREIKK